MAGESTSLTWATNNVLNVMVSTRFIEYANRAAVIAPLVAVEDLEGKPTKKVYVGRWPDLSGTTLTTTEGTDFSDTAVAPTAVALTAAVLGISFEIMDLLAESSPLASVAQFTPQGAGVLAQKADDDIAALFAALNGGTAVGSTGVDLSLANLIDGIVALDSNQAVGQAVAVLHPRQIGDLAASVGAYTVGGSFAGTQSAGIIDKLANTPGNGFVMQFAGLNIYKSPRCPSVNSGADRSGAIFTRDAITMARKWGIRSETIRNPRGPSLDLVLTAAYAVAETADQFGIPVTTDL